MSKRNWSNLPFLDALRPDPDWQAEWCVLATYSVDLVAVVAAMMAMAGVDDDRGSGSKVDFANAFEHMRNRMRVLAQRGRLAVPHKSPRILAILDQFVREVREDERDASWHPKLALAKLTSNETGAVEWRFWIGSRNLTRDISWDTGLSLVGRAGGEGETIDGIDDLSHELCARADLPGVSAAKARRELRNVAWQVPSGCSASEIALHIAGAERDLPDAPDGLRRLLVVSPFLDGNVVSRLGSWGGEGTERLLLSTATEVRKLATQKSKPLTGFKDCLVMECPDLQVDAEDEPESDDERLESRGLHAKMILAEHRGGRTLWLGSANATGRGWLGQNAEAIARLSVDKAVADGLIDFAKAYGRTVDVSELDGEEEVDKVEERLEIARKQVAASWQARLSTRGMDLTLTADRNLHPDDAGIALEVGILGGAATKWPRQTRECLLPRVSPDMWTQLVRCRLTLSERTCEWLQVTPFDPPLTDERDRQALARFLDPKTFLQWIRSLLTGDAVGDGGGDWDERGQRSAHRPAIRDRPIWWAPTLEEVLKSWSRDPGAVKAVDRKVKHYLKLMANHPDIERDPDETQVLATFEKTWKVLRQELVVETK